MNGFCPTWKDRFDRNVMFTVELGVVVLAVVLVGVGTLAHNTWKRYLG